MAFIIPHAPLTPRRGFELGLAPGCKVVRAEALAPWGEARDVLAAARQEAQRIVDQAQAAYQDECRRGYEEGREQARLEQAAPMIENVSRNVEYFSKVEGRMVDLVMQAVQKIISDFDDRERVLITVRNVLAVVRNQKQMTLRLNPQQVDVVRARLGELLAEYPGVGYIDVVGDNRLQADACILESEIGLVEASMDSQLAALRNAFHKVLGSRI